MRKIFFLLAYLVVGVTLHAQLKSESYISRYGHLHNIRYRIRAEKKATVAFLGGSITHMKGWRDSVCAYLTNAYPGTVFNFINAGIPSLGSVPHAFRLQRDVLDKGRIDLLFIESAVNDRVNGTPPITQRRALEGIVRHALTANPATDIVLMAFVDEDKMEDYRAGKTPEEVRAHESIAKRYHLPFINLAREVTDRIDAGEFTWKNDFKDLHPSPFGQHLYFNTIRQLLETALHQPTPKQTVPAQLPPPAERFNYASAGYLDIHQAVNKKGFEINESWQPADSTPTRPGFVRVPVLVSNGKAASLELPFTGRTIGIGVLSGPDAGNISYSVDDQPLRQANLYTQWSKSLYLPWYLVLADDLKPGKHVLKLHTAGPHPASATNVCRIVYFLVNK